MSYSSNHYDDTVSHTPKCRQYCSVWLSQLAQHHGTKECVSAAVSAQTTTEGRQTADLHSTYTLIAYHFCLFSFLHHSRIRKLRAASIHISTTRPMSRSIRQEDTSATTIHLRGVGAFWDRLYMGFLSFSLLKLAEAARLVVNS